MAPRCPPRTCPATAGMDNGHGPRREAIRTAIAGKIPVGDEYLCAGWCCTDCLMMLANGDEPEDWTYAELEVWRTDIAHYTEGYNVVLGMFATDHDCKSNWTLTDTAGETYEYYAKDITEVLSEHAWKHDLAEVASAVAHELETEGDRGGECECEQMSFSSSWCDVCGSHLAGSRDSVTFWKILYR